jgi:hypothetical protein
MDFAEIKNDFEKMRNDLEQLNCSITLTGGMKTKGYSTHDIDVRLIILKEKTFEKIKSVLQKYNKGFYEKYDLYLHAVVIFKGEFFEQYYGIFDIIEEAKRQLEDKDFDMRKFRMPHG